MSPPGLFYVLRPIAIATLEAAKNRFLYSLRVICCLESQSANLGALCTSISNPSALAANAAKERAFTYVECPDACDGSTTTGRCVLAFRKVISAQQTSNL